MQFGLKSGMKNEQVINELKGRTSGETQEEVYTFLNKYLNGQA